MLLAGAAAVGAFAALWQPHERVEALDCDPAALGVDDGGVVRCGMGAPLPGGQALLLGQRIDLNRAAAADLSALPGVGADVAHAIVEHRAHLGRFRSWSEVAQVPGVGIARLEVLQRHAEIPGPDAGVW